MKKILAGIAAMFCIAVIAACNRDDKPTPIQPGNQLTALATKSTTAGIKVTLYAYGPLKTGYNKLYVGLRLNGGILTGADVQLQPMMEMNGMVHSCPVEQPVVDTNIAAYAGAVVFTMPSATDMTWNLNVSIDNDEVVFPISVSEAEHKTTGIYTGTDSTQYVVTLLPKENWQVGLNDFELLVNRTADMMSFPTADNFMIDFTPEMPSMGHSSPNNVNPESSGHGHYKGTANLTMTGDWRLHFKLKRNDTVIVSDAYADIQF